MSGVKLIQSQCPVNKVKKLGQGAYGIVYKVGIDGEEYALKRNVVDTSINYSGSIRELDTMLRLYGHPYIIKLKSIIHCENFLNNIFTPIDREYLKDDDLHFMIELAAYDGSNIVKKNNKYSIGYIKMAMMQILLAVEYMHKKGITHRDLKMSNMLWYRYAEGSKVIKVGDFGLSKPLCYIDKNTPRVVTCWYRAPEIILRQQDYHEKSDMWSIGCMFYEMIKGSPLLMGCDDDNDKLMRRILSLLPCERDQEFINMLRNSKVQVEDHLLQNRKITWTDILKISNDRLREFNTENYEGLYNPGTYDQFLDLLSKLFVLNPSKRYSATQALNHPFFSGYNSVISTIRSAYPPTRPPIPYTIIMDKPERLHIVDIVKDIYTRRSVIRWYSNRILFLALDIFDRYLYYIHTEQSTIVHTPEESQIRFYVALYISMKYYNAMCSPCTFAQLIKPHLRTPDILRDARKLEKFFLRDVLKWQIYRETMYEMCNYYNGISEVMRDNLEKMLMYYCSIVEFKGPIMDIFQHFFSTIDINLPPINYKSETEIIPDSWPVISKHGNAIIISPRNEKEDNIILPRHINLKNEEQKAQSEKERKQLEQQRLEQERLEQEKQKQLEKQRLEQEKQKQLEWQRLEQEKQKRLEQQRLEQEKQKRLEQQRLEQEKRLLEWQRLEQEKQKQLEQQRLEQEKRLLERQRLEQEKRLLEQQRLEQEKRLLEQQRLEQERLEQEKQKQLEQQRLEQEKKLLEQQRLEQEKKVSVKSSTPQGSPARRIKVNISPSSKSSVSPGNTGNAGNTSNKTSPDISPDISPVANSVPSLPSPPVSNNPFIYGNVKPRIKIITPNIPRKTVENKTVVNSQLSSSAPIIDSTAYNPWLHKY